MLESITVPFATHASRLLSHPGLEDLGVAVNNQSDAEICLTWKRIVLILTSCKETFIMNRADQSYGNTVTASLCTLQRRDGVLVRKSYIFVVLHFSNG